MKAIWEYSILPLTSYLMLSEVAFISYPSDFQAPVSTAFIISVAGAKELVETQVTGY